METLSVKEFNRVALIDYQKSVSRWQPGKGGFPSLAMALFLTPEGNTRQRGFVVSNGDSHHFYLTRKELK